MTDEFDREDRETIGAIDAAFRPYRFDARRPLGRGSRRPWVAVAATVAIAVIVAAIVWRPPSALGSWTSEPTTSDPQALATDTARACREQAQTLVRVGDQADWPDDPALSAMERTPLVAYDQRGEASAALFAEREADSMWICAIVPITGQPAYVELAGGAGVIPADLGQVEVWMATAGWNSDYGGRWEIAGRVDPAVGQLTILTEDEREVIATIDDGWFLAWWPSESEPVRLELHAADGEVLDTINLGDRYAHEPGCRFVFLEFCVWQH